MTSAELLRRTIPLVLPLAACAVPATRNHVATESTPSLSPEAPAPTTAVTPPAGPARLLLPQDDAGPELRTADDQAAVRRFTVSGWFSSYADADADDFDGEVGVTRYGLGLWYTPPAEGRSTWQLGIAQEESDYDFDQDTGLDETGDGSETTFSVRRSTPGEQWDWFVGGNMISGTDDGADFSDGLWFEALGGFMYEINDKLDVGLMIIFREVLEEDAEFTAFPLVEWTINDKNSVRVESTTDPSIVYTYGLGDRLDVYGALQFSTRQYAIDEDLVDSAAFVDREQNLRGGVVYQDGKGLKLEGFLGIAQRTLEINVDDDEVADSDVDPTLFLGLGASYAF